MKKKILIIGTSGHAKVVIDIVEREGKYEIYGLIDTYKAKGGTTFGYKILGTEEDLPEIIEKHNVFGGIVAIGDNYVRMEMVNRIRKIKTDFNYVNAIHPKSVIGSKVRLGKGIVIMPGVIVNTQAWINDFCVLNTKSTLDHECKMKRFSSLGPGTNVGGNVEIGECTAISLGAKIIENLRIGEHTVIGAGSLVLNNINENKVVYGVPAKEIRKRNPGDKYLSRIKIPN